jgi:hypothetical protein
VFAVPGVYVTLPSARGDVRFTPLFLSRELLEDTVSGVQDIVTRYASHTHPSLKQSVRCKSHPWQRPP